MREKSDGDCVVSLDSFLAYKGVVGVGEFDETGRLKAYRSKLLSPEQADSTARLSGSLVTLLDTIMALYSRFCGVPIAPFQSVKIEGLEYSIMLVSSAKTCLGIIGKNDEVDFDAIKKELVKFGEGRSA